MNNYFVLIYLNSEIKEKISGGKYLFAISPHKDVLEIYIESEVRSPESEVRSPESEVGSPESEVRSPESEVGSAESGERVRLIFSANPSETALFLDGYRPPKKSNVMAFFEPLEGKRITGTRLAEGDRLWGLQMEGEYRLVFKLYGGNPNVYLTRGEEVADAFKNPGEAVGRPVPEAHPPSADEQPRMKAKPKNRLTGLHPKLPRNLLPDLIRQHEVGEMDAKETVVFGERIVQAMLEDPHPRVLATGDLTLWSEELLDIPADRAFDSVNDAVRHAYRNAVHLRRLTRRREKVERFLERQEARKSSRLEQLRQADKSLDRADAYERSAHLLMAHAHEEIDPGADTVTVANIYEENEPVEIEVDSSKGFAGNAEQYYDKARSARRSYEEARRQIPRVERELGRVRKLLEELSAVERLPEMDDWLKEHEEELEELGFGAGGEEQASSPFRKLKVGKYEVWVGKSASGNDDLTSQAHKEDVWLHARGVAGSHVVIRMGNVREYPPQEVILQAAGFAAWFSKARGMKSAPVMYTKRKYVRKPKGAAPGAVKVQREEVVMVPPVEPRKQHQR